MSHPSNVFQYFESKFLIPKLGFLLNIHVIALHATNHASTTIKPLNRRSPPIMRCGEDRVDIAAPEADVDIQVLLQILDSGFLME